MIQGIGWGSVFRDALDRADEELATRCAWYARRPLAPFGAAPSVFAALVTGHSLVTLWDILDNHTADPLPLIGWLQETGHVVVSAVTADDIPQTPAATVGRLTVGPGLEGLPLLDLAEDVARHRGGLAVATANLPPGLAGSYNREQRRILLGVEHGSYAWPHELAHALDPWLPRHLNPVADERFADDLGALLTKHQPSTLAEAQPYIGQCLGEPPTAPSGADERGTHPVSTPGLPEPGVASLMAFLTLPLLPAPIPSI